jgi:acetylglutamate kinase
MAGLAGLAGRFVVLKLGGAAEIDLGSMAEEILALGEAGARVVVVHGGGKELSAALERAGKESNFIEGLRATDAETLEIAVMVFAGKVNKEIVARLLAAGVKAAGLSGVDGGVVTVTPRLEPAGLGFVGEVETVDTDLLAKLVDGGFVPVVAPVASDKDGQIYNINADTLAGEIAAKLGAARLVFLTDVPGVLDASGETIALVTPALAAELSAAGTVSGGMIPKIDAALRWLGEVEEVHIMDGSGAGAVRDQLAGEGRVGTRFAPD